MIPKLISHTANFYSNDEGGFSLMTIPGCSGLGLSYGTYVSYDKRGKGIGQAHHKFRLAESASYGHAYLICTVRDDNKVEKHILAKNGWAKLADFLSPDSCDDGHRVEIWGRRHNQEEPKVQS